MKAIKVRIYPTHEQVDFLNRQFGAVRMVYNKGIAIMQNRYKRHSERLRPRRELKALLKPAKSSRRYSWLSEYDSTSLQQSLINLDKAFIRFFKKIGGYPKFKSKHARQSSYHCSSTIGYGEDWIKIGKLKTLIKARIHRKIEGRISSVTLSKTNTGKYYASMVFADNLNKNIKKVQQIKESKVIGVDIGLTNIMVDSNCRKETNPRFLKNATKNLRAKQKKLSRKQKGSKTRNRARLLVAKCHERLANIRNDFQHKISKTIIDENQAIIVETLKVKNMLRNRKLSKHIADASWGSLLTKLEYKVSNTGKHFKKIDQWYASSKICSVCGYKAENMGLEIRKWQCASCQTKHDRDINAAINIKQQGLVLLKAEGLSVSAN